MRWIGNGSIRKIETTWKVRAMSQNKKGKHLVSLFYF